MKRRGILVGLMAAVLTLVLGTSVCGAESAAMPSGTCGETWSSVTWTLDSAGTMTISGTGDMRDFSSGGDAPWASYKQTIRSVRIEDGVTSIGKNAFIDCPALTSVTMGKDVESIGEMAFYGCSGLTDVYYGGTAADWAKIAIDESNDPLLNVERRSGSKQVRSVPFHQ